MAVKKKELLKLLDSMDGPGDDCARQNKPVRGRQIPYDPTRLCTLMKQIH